MKIGDLVREKPHLAPSAPRVGIITNLMSRLIVVQWIGAKDEEVVAPYEIYMIREVQWK